MSIFYLHMPPILTMAISFPKDLYNRPGDVVRYGVAFCSPKDQYCKETGRAIALYRLRHGMDFRLWWLEDGIDKMPAYYGEVKVKGIHSRKEAKKAAYKDLFARKHKGTLDCPSWFFSEFVWDWMSEGARRYHTALLDVYAK